MQPSMSEPFVEHEPSEGVMNNYASKAVRDLSVFHIVLGILCIVCQFITIANEDRFSYIASGIWGGILIYCFLAFSIATSVSAFFIILSSSLSCLDPNDWDDITTKGTCVRERCHYDVHPISCVYNRDLGCEILLGMNYLLLIVAVVELVISISASVFCCYSTCYSQLTPENESQDVFYPAPPPYSGQEGQAHKYQIMDFSGLMITHESSHILNSDQGKVETLLIPNSDADISEDQCVSICAISAGETRHVLHSNHTSLRTNLSRIDYMLPLAQHVPANDQDIDKPRQMHIPNTPGYRCSSPCLEL